MLHCFAILFFAGHTKTIVIGLSITACCMKLNAITMDEIDILTILSHAIHLVACVTTLCESIDLPLINEFTSWVAQHWPMLRFSTWLSSNKAIRTSLLPSWLAAKRLTDSMACHELVNTKKIWNSNNEFVLEQFSTDRHLLLFALAADCYCCCFWHKLIRSLAVIWTDNLENQRFKLL